MKKIIIFITAVLAGFFAVTVLYSESNINLSGVRAYPVPFFPDRGVLTIDNKDGSAVDGCGAGCSARLEVYDINGDRVASRSYSGIDFNDINGAIVWNGRNNKGNRVSPGFYILKLTVRGDNDSYGKKIIKIVVQ